YHSDFAASQIQYAFRTSKAGKTSAWSPFSTRNRILYSSLESGQSHRFEIQARTPDGLISDSTASLQIILRQKPFYLQSWFYWSIFSWILMLIAGYFMYRYSWIKRVLNQRRFNPYIAGEPILNSELFFGRKEIIDHILAILPNNNIMITGERRIGKTSLLMQIRQQLQMHPKPPVSFIPIFVDLQGVEQWEFFRALTHDILEQIGDSIVSLPLKMHHVSTDYGYRDFNSDFRKILNHISARQSRPVKLVLLIDEADAMNEYDQIIHAQLRRIFMQDFSLNFGAIIAGTHYIQSWNRPESPWWNLFTMIGLQAFSEPDAQQLIQAPVKGIFKYTPEAIAEILNQTEAKPYAIQTLCLNLVARAFERGRRKIERADVLAVVESLNWEMKQVT
ncbi:ATP-binding protein, partial [candidate division KSB1 bacterium]|nr:ATP-binding protein [candidate division KSB1 bacterium]